MQRTEVPTGAGLVAVRHTERVSQTATVLLHGAAGSWTTWQPAIAAASASGTAPSDLVVPDLPGWGESPADVSTLDAADLAASVAAVARALGYRRWRLVGHSLGGFVALELAVQEPEATESVVLVSGTTFGGHGDRLRTVQLVRAYAPLMLLALGMRVLVLLGPAASPLVRVLDRTRLLALLIAPLFDTRMPAVVHELARDLRPAAFLRALACARRYPAAERWSRIRCQVRSVHGDRDVFVPPSDDPRLAAIIPLYRAIVLPATGHFGHTEHPSLFAAELRPR